MSAECSVMTASASMLRLWWRLSGSFTSCRCCPLASTWGGRRMGQRFG